MRWNRSNVAFSRPIRWLLALFGEQVVPFEYAGLTARAAPPAACASPARRSWPSKTRRLISPPWLAQGILLDVAERQRRIRGAGRAPWRQAVQGSVPADPALLAEVTNLVEAPAALLRLLRPRPPGAAARGADLGHEEAPALFPGGEGRPRCCLISSPWPTSRPPTGTSQAYPLVVDGNEHVIRARFADAAFFVREDLKTPAGRLPAAPGHAHLPGQARLDAG